MHRNAFLVDLGGDWKFRCDPNNLGEHYAAQLDYAHAWDARWMQDDSKGDWRSIAAPGPWPHASSAPAVPIWFRRSFEFAGHDGRAVLHFEGINYFSDVWLNGRFLGSHEGYVGQIKFVVTGLLQASNELVVKVIPAHDVLGQEDQMAQMKRHFVGALGRWDMNNPEQKPAGIWGNVWLDLHGHIGIEKANLTYRVRQNPSQCDEEVPVDCVLSVLLSGHSDCSDGPVDLDWSVEPVGFDAPSYHGGETFALVRGERAVSIDFVHAAQLWWTWDLGHPRQYRLVVRVSKGGVVSDRHEWNTGFRDLVLGVGWDVKLNGRSLYQRGANYLSDLDLSSMTLSRYKHDIKLMKSANLNTVHPFCHVERDTFYEACDAAGMLVYQDFPIWMMADTDSALVRQALHQFDEIRDRLDGRPCVGIWNFGSQASVANMDKLCPALTDRARRTDPSRIAHMGNAAISYQPRDDVHPTKSFFGLRRVPRGSKLSTSGGTTAICTRDGTLVRSARSAICPTSTLAW